MGFSTLEGFVTHKVREYQVLVSFNNDEDALPFEEWWFTEGEYLYREWIENHA